MLFCASRDYRTSNRIGYSKRIQSVTGTGLPNLILNGIKTVSMSKPLVSTTPMMSQSSATCSPCSPMTLNINVATWFLPTGSVMLWN